MSVAARTREWVSEHPGRADVLLATGAFVVSMLPFVLGSDQLRPDLRLTPSTVALCAVGWNTVLQYLPTNAAAAFTAVTSTGDSTLGVAAGMAVLAAWAVAAVGAAAVSIVRRDV